ncbi:MAG TPA: flavin reductase family protein [Acidimicrobiia bacterium]|jgi:flavin reductase (DIM6/NTAB) family NADH-FMN oxidoreductase RutF|nr:flavin reductase family protein [Acidimicrobiia bacterium]
MIHGEHPFAPDASQLDPVRRFRGRLTAPVAVVTSGSQDSMTGLTVSSLLVIEGDPGRVQLVVGPTSDLWDSIEATSRFVIHVCREPDRHVAEVFSGSRPSPGGVFAGLEITPSEWGPVIASLTTRAFCTLETADEMGWSGLVTARIDRVETEAFDDPLSYFRGRFRTIE